MSDAALIDLLDLLARRFALPVVLALQGRSYSFTVLAAQAEAPPSVLAQRLRELREAALVEVDEGGDYRLTGHGRRLLDPLGSLADFATGWAKLTRRQRKPRGAADRGRGE